MNTKDQDCHYIHVDVVVVVVHIEYQYVQAVVVGTPTGTLRRYFLSFYMSKHIIQSMRLVLSISGIDLKTKLDSFVVTGSEKASKV